MSERAPAAERHHEHRATILSQRTSGSRDTGIGPLECRSEDAIAQPLAVDGGRRVAPNRKAAVQGGRAS